MEYLGWECSPNVSSWWTSQQCEIGEIGEMSDSIKTEDDFLNPIQQLMIHKRTSVGDDYLINSEKLVSQMVQHLAVPPLDSIIVASTINYSWQHEQRQLEAIRLASANNTILVSESGAACASWESEADLCNSNSPNSIKMKPGFGIMPQDIKAAAVLSAVSTTASMDSLDCLLSATNSATDTTISSAHQDDAINSILFSQSHCQNSVLSGDSGKDDDHKCLYQEIYTPNSSSTAARSNNNIHHSQIFQGGEYCSNKGGGFNFQLISGNDHHPPEAKKARLLENKRPSSSNINFQQPSSCNSSANYVDDQESDSEAIAQMKEMIYRAAAFRPVNLGDEVVVEKPRRKNVKVSSDPQTVAARQRRERISEKIRVLQKLVPGGTKMDTASMLDEAANYLKFLRSQVKALETLGQGHNNKLDSFVMNSSSFPFNHSFPMQTPHFSGLPKP